MAYGASPDCLPGWSSREVVSRLEVSGAMAGTPIACIVPAVDEGLPIAYQLLDDGVPVLASDGTPVGTVMSVLAAPEEDVFHGLLIATSNHGVRFVEAGLIAAIHERGCDLRIDAVAAGGLPEPEHKAPVFSEDPDRQQGWRHWVHHITRRSDWNRER